MTPDAPDQLFSGILPGGFPLPKQTVGPGTRLVATALDHLILAGLFVAALPLLAAVAPEVIGLAPRIGLFFYVAYYIVGEAFTGRSLAKVAMGMRVVREDAGPLRRRDILTRNLVRFSYVLLWPLLADGLPVFFTQRGQRTGDLLAGTLVIHEGHPRLSRSYLLRIPFRKQPTVPRTALEKIALTPAELMALRTFCFRTRTMTKKSRSCLAGALLPPLYARAGWPVPDALEGEDLIVDLLHHSQGTFGVLGPGISPNDEA